MPQRRIEWMTSKFAVAVFERLRALPVACLEHVPLAPRTTWKIGGPARFLLQPDSRQAVQRVLSLLPEEMPRLVLGGGSNILIDDAGFQGVVLDLTHRMNQIYRVDLSSETEDSVLLHVEAGATTRALAHFARLHGLTGAEFLGGIPGSVGGALRMNAGAYGGEIQDILVEVELLDAEGQHRSLPVQALGMSYRTTQVPSDWIFLSARVRLHRGDPEVIREKMRHLNQSRKKNQPLRFPSAGSTFKNPLIGPKAWQWIDAAGMRGAWQGAAQVSELHSNFLVNRGGACSQDMKILIERVQERVLRVGGQLLSLEVGIVGPFGRVSTGEWADDR